MLPTPFEIKEKLSKALEDTNDVDDATVVEMVSILEKYPITRTTLEETKIGKMVNDLRKKIKNDKLAKRVKQLVRNWKKILDQTASVNGSPRPVHPAIAHLQSSPSVSPSLIQTSGADRLVSPAQDRGKPSTAMLLGSQRCISPAQLGNRSGVVGGHKGISPALAASRSSTPTSVGAQRVASPALSGPRAIVPSGRIASPAVSFRLTSPATSDRVPSPAVSGRLVSPAPGKGQRSPLALYTPPSQPSTLHSLPVAGASGKRDDEGSLSAKQKTKGRMPAVVDNSNCSGRLTPTSQLSDNSQDRVLWETDNIRHDSDDDSSCSSSRTGQLHHVYPHNHSTGVSLTNSSEKNVGKDQRELSKTNVANRKRTRENSNSPPDVAHKKPWLESSSLSAGHRQDKVVNGYLSKSSKKNLPGVEIPRVSSTSSLPSVHKNISSPIMSSALTDDRISFSHSDSLLRQESSDSFHSAQSFDRPSRDKHKVKTTEQLIEGLQKKNNSSSVCNSIITKLRTNQIEKEKDVPGSVLPAGIKPRGKRGRHGKNDDISLSVPSSNAMLSQVKNELVERFLKTSDPPLSVEEYSPFKEDILHDTVQSTLEPKLEFGTCGSSYSKDNFDGSFSASRQDRSESAPKDENSMDAVSPPVPSTSKCERTGSALTLQEIYSHLPPVDNNIDWDAVEFYELPAPLEVTEESIDRLHEEHLPGINGLFDINGDWKSWQEVVTLPSYEGSQLHILPYVDLDN